MTNQTFEIIINVLHPNFNLRDRLIGEYLNSPLMEWLMGEGTTPEVLNREYAHGGGWFPLEGWQKDFETGKITFEGEETYDYLFYLVRDKDVVFFYPHSWIAVQDYNGKLIGVTRCD